MHPRIHPFPYPSTYIMIDHIQKNEILINQQCGFRKNHSTIHQLIRVSQFITHNCNVKRLTAMVSLDLHKFLLHKLHPLIIKLIHNYLINRKLFVQIGNDKSEPSIIMAGVPQGYVLGPSFSSSLSTIFPPLQTPS